MKLWSSASLDVAFTWRCSQLERTGGRPFSEGSPLTLEVNCIQSLLTFHAKR